jgi:hypothetical protein
MAETLDANSSDQPPMIVAFNVSCRNIPADQWNDKLQEWSERFSRALSEAKVTAQINGDFFYFEVLDQGPYHMRRNTADILGGITGRYVGWIARPQGCR